MGLITYVNERDKLQEEQLDIFKPIESEEDFNHVRSNNRKSPNQENDETT